MLRTFRYGLEGGLILFAVLFFRLLPLDAASALAGALARFLGPFSGAHRTARKNLAEAMPELSVARRDLILSGMWDNLGRTIGEYPHLNRPIMARRITLEGREYLEPIKTSGKSVIFVSGHFANQEILPLCAAHEGVPLVLIYRRANNPVAEWVIRKIRAPYNRGLFGKGRSAATQTLRAIKEGHAIGMLIDQKQNDGQNVPFFGRDAKTATAAAHLAIKFGVPVMLAQLVRTHGAYFQVILEPPLHCGPDDDPVGVMGFIHSRFEQWIREHPAQWFWVHRRWG